MGLLSRWLWAVADVGLGRRYSHSGDDSTDCIRLTAAVLGVLYPEISWPDRVMHLHGYSVGSMANVDQVIESGAGVSIRAPDLTESGVYYCQGWGRYGHCFFLAVRPRGTLWIVEASNLTSDWVRPVVWADVVDAFPDLRIARLQRPAPVPW